MLVPLKTRNTETSAIGQALNVEGAASVAPQDAALDRVAVDLNCDHAALVIVEVEKQKT